MAIAFAAHSSREIQAACAPSAMSDAAGDEDGEEEAINDPLAQPEFASGSGGDHAHSQAGVTDRVWYFDAFSVWMLSRTQTFPSSWVPNDCRSWCSF